MRLEVILQKGEDGYFVASCPAIKGCHSQGRTKREALENVREAVLGCLEVLNDRAKRFGRRHHAELAQVAV
ncbi:MAG: type II toxin-antitoxin system HicB family antitoxin [Candidatus Omnitrophica bacterium]|nr:type II toxin-antitoxin system HicB family antitoxin [Candidatus Omnitrophota bacterium]